MQRYKKPETLSEAEKRTENLEKELIIIKKHLGNKNKKNTDGKRLSNKEFWLWRTKKLKSLDNKNNEITFIKECIDKINHNSDHKIIDVNNPAVTLLKDAINIIEEMAEDIGDDITRREMNKIDEINNFLKRVN